MRSLCPTLALALSPDRLGLFRVLQRHRQRAAICRQRSRYAFLGAITETAETAELGRPELLGLAVYATALLSSITSKQRCIVSGLPLHAIVRAHEQAI